MHPFKQLFYTSLFLLMALIFVAALQIPKTTGQESDSRQAVLELFTSQGCSSCPPADEFMGELAKQDPSLIILCYHVDYWDRLGWRDPYSSQAYTKRQKEYGEHFSLNSIYTPQLVVNGKKEMVGSDRAEINEEISRNNLAGTGKIQLSAVKAGGDSLEFEVDLDGKLDQESLNIALVQKMTTTSVGAGENNGRKLQNFNIVRSLSQFPDIHRGHSKLSVKIPPGISPGSGKVVAFLQNNQTLEILNANQVEW